MGKQKRGPSILQDEKKCFITGATEPLDVHHCFHGPRRAAADRWGCWIWLRRDLHRELHDKNKALDKMIEQTCQTRFEELYGHEKFMEVFGKNYLDEEG